MNNMVQLCPGIGQKRVPHKKTIESQNHSLTPPKFNSSPLKSYLANRIYSSSHHFSGENSLLNFGGVLLLALDSNLRIGWSRLLFHSPVWIEWCETFCKFSSTPHHLHFIHIIMVTSAFKFRLQRNLRGLQPTFNKLRTRTT